MTSNDLIDKKADELVAVCNILGVSSLDTLTNKFNFARSFDPEDWEFFATSAAVMSALQTLAHGVSKERFDPAYDKIQQRLREWHEQGPAAVQDCLEFVNRGGRLQSDDEVLQTTWNLGAWVLWNMFKRQPTADEDKAAIVIGGLLALPLADWWTTPSRP